MNLLVICASGMSSSALVSQMRLYVKEQGLSQYKIGSCASNEADDYVPLSDIVYISPHMQFLLKELSRKYPEKKFYLIRKEDYGLQNVEAILAMLHEEQHIEEEKTSPLTRWVTNISSTFARNKIVQAISVGMTQLALISVIGSIFILAINFPLPLYQQFITKYGIDTILNMGQNATIGSLSIYACYTISNQVAKQHAVNPSCVKMTSLICLLVLNISQKGYIDTEYLGSNGFFVSMFVSIVASNLFILIYQKEHFKLEGVPEMIIQGTLAIIPLIVCLLVFTVLAGIFQQTAYHSLPSFILHFIQINLMHLLGNNIVSDMVMQALCSFLWFFGIHGGNIVSSFYKPILLALSYADIEAYQLGETLPYIINSEFRNAYIFGGVGSTLGLCILMAFCAKSSYLKKLGKISLPMGVFFINEPVLFGLPLILNVGLIIPFVGIPIISGILTYAVMKFGIVPSPIGYGISWTTPPLISGMIQGGWKLMLWQLFMLVFQTILWYPFFKAQDHFMLQKETQK